MRLREYPRPEGDTGVGFHWFPDYRHYQLEQFETFVPLLKEMGASWLVLPSHPRRLIPESFIRGLLEKEIEPIVEISTPYVTFLDQDDLRDLCQRYAFWGVHYIYLFKEPNLARRWPQWQEEGLPGRFMNFVLPCLEAMYEVEGVVPLFPPLSPGGDFWDTTFLAACFDIINQEGKRDLYTKMGVAIENYAFNKPLSWGQGGQSRWTDAKPYQSQSEDHRGFYLFEWYDEIIRQKVGHSLPLLAVSNGVLIGDQSSPDYPPIDEALHAQRSAEISQMVMQGEVPNYLFNNAFWLLAAEDASPFAQHRWFTPDGQPVLDRSVAALVATPHEERRFRVDIPDRIRVLMEDGRVEVMELEEYLKGVLPREMGKNAPPEALKAQAVAARCYAAKAVRYPRHREKGADICTTTHCQVWSPTRFPATDRAVEETEGVVATHEDEIVSAYYFGHCDGHTRNSEDVWLHALPYCRSVDCICGYDSMYGHGVGMCQRGAMAMAEKGAAYEEILGHYYTGVEIVREGKSYRLPVAELAPSDTSRTELWEWPRPPQDNGLGIHAGLSFSDAALAEDLARVKDMGLKWVLLVPRDEIQLEKAVRLYWAEGVMPVVRPYTLIDRHHDFARDVRVMLACGTPPYIQIYNEPSDDREWYGGRPDLPLFVRRWVDNAVAVYDAGGYPGLQVLDVELLREVIAETRRRGMTYLWGRTWFCPHNYGLNHPPRYPYDPVNQRGIPVEHPDWEFVAPIEEVNRWREEGKNPGQTIHDDPNSILGFLAFAQVFEEELGFVPPMICGEGGWQYRSAQDRRYPVIGDYLHAQYHQHIFLWFKEGRISTGEPLPDYLFAICPWILSGGDADAWYSNTLGVRTRTIALVRAISSFQRELPSPPTPPDPEPDPDDPTRWTMSVERRPGARVIAGNFPRAGIRLAITDPWGNAVVVISGSKLEHGPGGFETPVWASGVYTLRFLDQCFQVRVEKDFLFLTFREESEGSPWARLVSEWTGKGDAETLWNGLESDERYESLFILQEQEEG